MDNKRLIKWLLFLLGIVLILVGSWPRKHVVHTGSGQIISIANR